MAQGKTAKIVKDWKLREKLANNVKALRRTAGESQPECAQRIGVSASFVSMLERGQRDASYEVLERIANAYDTSPQRLLS